MRAARGVKPAFLTAASAVGKIADLQPSSVSRGSGDPRYSRSGDRRYNEIGGTSFLRRVRNADYFFRLRGGLFVFVAAAFGAGDSPESAAAIGLNSASMR